jgi:hypothetical protein
MRLSINRYILLRRALVVIVALAISIVGQYWVFSIATAISSFMGNFDLEQNFGTDGHVDHLNTIFQISYDRLFVLYQAIFFPGVGMSITLTMWNSVLSRAWEGLLASILLLVSLPAFAINIVAQDEIIPYAAQAALDFIVGATSLYFVIVMIKQKYASLFLTIIKYLLATFISIFLVFVPLFYAIIWGLIRFGMSVEPRSIHSYSVQLTIISFGAVTCLTVLSLRAYSLRLASRETLVRLAAEKDRPEVTSFFERQYRVEVNNLDLAQRADIVIRQISARSRREVIFWSVITFVALLFGVVTILMVAL